MTFDPEARNVTVFIDLSNLDKSVARLNVRVDYLELRKYLTRRFNARVFNAYTSSNLDGTSTSFLDFLELNGYRLKKCKPKLDINGRTHEKAVDTSLVADMVRCVCKNMTNHIILITGDRDMLPAVEAAQNEGCLVTLLTYSEFGCDRDLGRTCDEHIMLCDEGDEALGVIQFNPSLLRSCDGTVEADSLEEVEI